MTAASRRRLRVLVVAGREPWPLNSGGRLRLFNFLSWLTRDTDVTLALPEPACHVGHLPSPLHLRGMTAESGRVRSSRAMHVPWIIRLVRRHFGYRPAVVQWLDRHARLESFDVALLYGAVTGQYIDAVRVPAVWDAVDELVLTTVRDAEWRGPRHWSAAARAAMLQAAFERHVAGRARVTVFASGVDASYARRWAGPARVEAISNGVDCDYFNHPTQPPEPGTVAFVGALNFPPNVEGMLRFTRRVWPHVQADGAGRRLQIVGRDPVTEVRALSRLPGVEVHANVPDVRPYLSRAAVVVVPTRLGGGVKNKVLEACAMGRPVVASSRALAGLSARRGRDVVCADTTAAWAQKVGHLLAQPTAAAAIGASGRQWVRHAHQWPVLAERLCGVLAAAAGWTSSAARKPALCHAAEEHMEIETARPDDAFVPCGGVLPPAPGDEVAASSRGREPACL